VRDFLDSDDGAGMIVVKTWRSAHDDRVRDSHRQLDGQEAIGLDTPFLLPDGGSILHPHDANAPASETINCRCSCDYRVQPKDDDA
jgi:uncharacterized protein with gpF-like domain